MESMTQAHLKRALDTRPIVFIGEPIRIDASLPLPTPDHDVQREAAMIAEAVKALAHDVPKHLPNHTAYDYYAYCAR